MSSFLPQHDPDHDDRTEELEEAREEYQWNHEYVSPLAMVEKVPGKDNSLFSLRWVAKVLDKLLDILANRAEDDDDKEKHRAFRHTQKNLGTSRANPEATVNEVIGTIKRSMAKAVSDRPQSLDDYAEMFRAIGLPPIAKDYTDDKVFANMRVAGPNPLMIERVSDLDERFPVTEALFQSVKPGDSLEAAGKEGRLYLADYEMLAMLKNGTYPEAQKYIYAPFSLYVVDKTSGDLEPVAIQCDRKPSKSNPIFTPNGSVDWLIAKTIVETADGNFHEAVSHLSRTHLFIEPFVVATHRNLAEKLPLCRLLMPHFWGTLFINDQAQDKMIAPGGTVDEVMAGTIETTRGLAVKGIETYPFDQAFLPETFKARGVDDKELLPNYPYRDDSMLYWNAIHEWVSEYLAIYYRSDADLQGDTELAAWFQDLVSQDGGRVKGLNTSSAFGTLDYLIDAVTLIIFTSSVQHAAVNFPQYDLMSYVPNVPGACYAKRRTRLTGATEQSYLDILPPLDQAQTQMEFLYLLGSVHYTKLGNYGRWQFKDRRVKAPCRKFQRTIENIDGIIKLRNQERRPYKFLIPKGIPQSINI